MKPAFWIFATLLFALIISIPGHTQDVVNDDAIYSLVANDKIEIVAQGDTYNTVKITGISLVEEDLHVVIPAGTYLAARLNDVQNMVVTKTAELDLPALGTFEVIVQTASLETHESVPVPGNYFTAVGDFSSALTDLIRVIGDSEDSYETIQAAVWIVTENPDYADMGIMRIKDGVVTGYSYQDFEGTDLTDEDRGDRLITAEDVVQAMIYAEQAGMDVHRKHIWIDNDEILNDLPAGVLLDWLTEKVESLR
ncbi:MAG: hypothetical protein NTY09_10030 [bacterium]|nr:hypothetical protein [bacterium]